MDDLKLKLAGKLCVVSFRSKDGKDCTYLGVDLGYTKKALTWRITDIAELLGISVVEAIDKFPVTPGQVNVTYLGE